MAAAAPGATSLSLAPPGPWQSQQSQEAVAAARMSEQRRQAELFGGYQQQHRHQQAWAAQAGLQQAWASAAAWRLQSQELMLYTVDGGAAGYKTRWEELHPVSQGLLLQIEYGLLCTLVRCMRDWCLFSGQVCGVLLRGALCC